MAYPKFKNKHLQEALFNPHDFLSYKNVKGNFPQKYIFIYDKRLFNYFKTKYKAKKIKALNDYSNAHFYEHNGICIVKMTGIGCPHAATVLEELIALGGKEFLNLGACGGLQHKGIFLCNRALRDEGTSYHYIPHGHYTYPDKKLTKKLGDTLKKLGIEYEQATTWTIDAPYRETKAEVRKYKKQGIATVEMEASALFAVAKVRKVKIAAAFAVSDVLGEKWDPGYHNFDYKKSMKKLLDAGVECLR